MEELPEPIRRAVRQLPGVPGAAVESSLEFIQPESSWALRLRLTSGHPSDFVPEETKWIALVDVSFPAGRIRIYPDQVREDHRRGQVHGYPGRADPSLQARSSVNR